MKILGIETSCDETAVCLIDANGCSAVGAMGTIAPQCNGAHYTHETPFQFRVLGNSLYSQVAIHAPYGGVFPNLAKREHAKNLVPLLVQTLDQAREHYITSKKLDPTDPTISQILEREPELLDQLSVFLEQYDKPNVDAIAVTIGPGLEPALWVGVNFARALSTAWDIPIVAVNHMEGHIIMSMVEQEVHRKPEGQTFQNGRSDLPAHLASFTFPLLSLLISGGHTELVLSRDWMQYERIGETRDDAVGEAFDKVARLLDLPYPGGPEISRLTHEARVGGLTSNIHFTPPMLHSGDFDFSFSGIKTEVRRLVESLKPLTDEQKMDIARAFEDAITHVLIAKTMKATEEYGAQTVIVGGGVSANTYIREQLAIGIEKYYTTSEKYKASLCISLLVPPPDLATDNAIMIALAGYFHAIKKEFADVDTLRANGNLRLG